MALIPIVTPSNRAYAVLAIPAIESIRKRPPDTTRISKHTRNASGFVVTNGYITIVHDTTQKNIYTTTTPTSQDTRIQYKDPNNSGKQNSIRVWTRVQIGLRVLKIPNGVHTLPRPTRKGNLANVANTNLQQRQHVPRKIEEGAGEYRRAYSARLDIRLPTPSGWWS